MDCMNQDNRSIFMSLRHHGVKRHNADNTLQRTIRAEDFTNYLVLKLVFLTFMDLSYQRNTFG